jgi:hypothetical protein
MIHQYIHSSFYLDTFLSYVPSFIPLGQEPNKSKTVEKEEVTGTIQKSILSLRLVYVCGLWIAGVLWCIVEVMKD